MVKTNAGFISLHSIHAIPDVPDHHLPIQTCGGESARNHLPLGLKDMQINDATDVR